MDILDDMGVSKLSAKVFSKVNYSFKIMTQRNYTLSDLFFYLLRIKTLTVNQTWLRHLKWQMTNPQPAHI